ncbi:MAG: hypothetical protein IT365_06035 [Candidatus Hydrogenedentes bacterium]|nr:hypothetical protein [Candidatus Hydrogenedentota bacterium]
MLEKGLQLLRSMLSPGSLIGRALRGSDGDTPSPSRPAYHAILDRMDEELHAHLASHSVPRGPRVLMGPSFSIYPPCYIHDRLLTCALRLRGAEIIPIYCDAVQSVECNVYGGHWTSGMSFAQACANCVRNSESQWARHPRPALKLSRYLDPGDAVAIDAMMHRVEPDAWHTYELDGLPFGAWARDILVNNYLVGDYHRIANHETLGRAHVRNLLSLYRAYARTLDDVKPDRIVSNDSYYGMWAVLQELAKRRSIPFYSHWSGTRPNAWCYAQNDASMNLDFRAPWPAFSAQPLTVAQRATVDAWLDGRRQGKGLLLDTASIGAHQSEAADLRRIEGKPSALLTANVIWDLAALNKQVVFSGMIDWIAETVRWFGEHPEFALIVKPHPAEANPLIPETVERVGLALKERGVPIPENVVLLTPLSRCSVYELLPMARAVLVHTSTVGVEAAARGVPVIASARSPFRGFGFTADPESPDAYFNAVEAALIGQFHLECTVMRDLACKYILFNMFHYYMQVDLMDYTFGEIPTLRATSLNDILPGQRPCFDYAVDSIMAGLPIVSETRWPPQS